MRGWGARGERAQVAGVPRRLRDCSHILFEVAATHSQGALLPPGRDIETAGHARGSARIALPPPLLPRAQAVPCPTVGTPMRCSSPRRTWQTHTTGALSFARLDLRHCRGPAPQHARSFTRNAPPQPASCTSSAAQQVHPTAQAASRLLPHAPLREPCGPPCCRTHRYTYLQTPTNEAITEFILHQYDTLWSEYQRQKHLVPPGRLVRGVMHCSVSGGQAGAVGAPVMAGQLIVFVGAWAPLPEARVVL